LHHCYGVDSVPERVRRNFLREKEAAQLLNSFTQKLRFDIKQLLDTSKPKIEVAEVGAAKIYYMNGRPLVANIEDTLIPTLLFERALTLLPKITVNMGAVPYICNGADLMAPGIVKIEGTFSAGDYVLVMDERHGKQLAIVVALADSQAIRSLRRGKVAKNVHYVGDDLWKELKKS